MKNFSHQIQDTINDEVKIINEKIIGTSFLEILKNKLIDRFIEELKDISIEGIKTSLTFDYQNLNNTLFCSLTFYNNQKIQLNTKIEKNLLLICLNGVIKIDLEDIISKKNNTIILNTNNGIILPSKTDFSINYSKNSLILSINQEDNEKDIEKKNDITI